MGSKLMIRDTSVNGTWVNNRRITALRLTELRLGDRMSFLPESHGYYPDALMYEVVAGCGKNASSLGRGQSSSDHSLAGRRGREAPAPTKKSRVLAPSLRLD